jgi:TPR repeat protein
MKPWILTLLAGGLLAFGVFGVADAGPLEDAASAYQRGDYSRAMSLLRPLAERGNAVALYDLGEMYFNGLGVPRDYGQAVAMYRKSAERGYALAQGNLGKMCVKDLGGRCHADSSLRSLGRLGSPIG